MVEFNEIIALQCSSIQFQICAARHCFSKSFAIQALQELVTLLLSEKVFVDYIENLPRATWN